MAKDYVSGSLVPFDFDLLLENVPELHQLNCDINSVSFINPIDSSNMNLSHWVSLAALIEEAYEQYDGFVVLHGSDTMSYTASVLSFMMEGLKKPIILTGSQLPIGDLRTDAKENLITSIQIATLQKNGEPVIQEVGLYFEYKLYRGNRTTKMSAEQFNAFVSMNYPVLVESGVNLKVAEGYLFRSSIDQLIVRKQLDDNIALLKLHPGITKKFVQQVFDTPNLKAVVMETYGAGNATTDEWFVSLLKNAMAKNIQVINVTQCPRGSVVMGQYKTSKQLQELQVIDGKDITTESALAKCMYLLGVNVASKDFKHYFETSLRGEML
jgi:L-asparaginase